MRHERRSGSSNGGSLTLLVLASALVCIFSSSTFVEGATTKSPTTFSPTNRYPTMSPVFQCVYAGATKVGLQACQRGMTVKDYCLEILFKVQHLPEPECDAYATKSPTFKPTVKRPTTCPTQSPQTRAEYEMYRTWAPTMLETRSPTTKPPTYPGQTYSPTFSTKSPTNKPTTQSPVRSTGGTNDATQAPAASQQQSGEGGASSIGIIVAVFIILAVLVVTGLLYRRRQREARAKLRLNNLGANEYGGGGVAGGYAKASRTGEIDIT